MNYQEFLKYIKTNNLTVKNLEENLGYSRKSILNNWKKNNNVPDKALITIKMYLRLKETETEVNNLLTKNTTINSIQISSSLHKLAKDKSTKVGISIEEYISSLIIANI